MTQVRRVGERAYKVRSRDPKKPSTWYRVDIAVDGEPICSCLAATAQRIPRACWHAELIRRNFVTTDNETTTGRELVIVKPTSVLPTTREMQAMEHVAAHLALTGSMAVPIIKVGNSERPMNAQEIRAVVFRGWELGVKPMTALQHFAVVNGKVEPDGQLMAAIVRASESDARLDIIESTDKKCTVRIERPSRAIKGEITVEYSDAEKAGLTSHFGWKNYPKDMLRWHAIKRACRIYAGDLVNAVGAPSALPGAQEAAQEDDDAIEGDYTLAREDLYNPGDAPANVDRETGEIIDAKVEHGDTQEAGPETRAAGPTQGPPPAPPPDDSAPLQDEGLRRKLAALLTAAPAGVRASAIASCPALGEPKQAGITLAQALDAITFLEGEGVKAQAGLAV